MKIRTGIVALLVVGLTMLGAAALGKPSLTYAETNSEAARRTLDVTGRGTLTVKPDTATITLGVSVMEPTAGEAYKAMAVNIAKVMDTMKARSVKEEQIKTGMLNLHPEYNWTQNEGQKLRGFRATNTVQIETQDMDKLPDLITAAIESGANELQGIRFSVKNTDKLMEQAMDLAVDDAKAKAERVAKRLGTEVIGVYRISVNDNGVGPVQMYAMSGVAEAKMAMDAAPAVYAGTNEFTVTVSVTFEVK